MMRRESKKEREIDYQKRRISGSHICLQFLSDFGFPIEKQRSTTSDLFPYRKKTITIFHQAEELLGIKEREKYRKDSPLRRSLLGTYSSW